MQENELTILTPTYNRGSQLKELYNSLINQTDYNFIWMIVDDGSHDDTETIVEKFETKKFPIRYFKKINGGKHTAINYSLQKVNTDLFWVVDSDDIIVEDAVQTLHDEWSLVENKNLAGVVFQKATINNREISWLQFKEERFIDNYIDMINKYGKNGEVAIVWDTKILKRYPFPIYKNEKYVPESAVIHRVSEDYDMLFVNKIIYLFEYLENGLTKSGRKVRIESPLGGIYLAKVILNSKKFNMRYKIKWMVLYICYSFFANIAVRKMYKEVPIKTLFMLGLPFGYVLYKFWANKYL